MPITLSLFSFPLQDIILFHHAKSAGNTHAHNGVDTSICGGQSSGQVFPFGLRSRRPAIIFLHLISESRERESEREIRISWPLYGPAEIINSQSHGGTIGDGGTLVDRTVHICHAARPTDPSEAEARIALATELAIAGLKEQEVCPSAESTRTPCSIWLDDLRFDPRV